MINTLSQSTEFEEDLKNISMRPSYLKDFIGQKTSTENLQIFINAAMSRKEPLDHVLFYGPPGLGKTTLAQIIAKEMGVNFRSTAGPLLNKVGDLAAILTNLQPSDVLFIDEIHRLNKNIEEVLYPAMEDFWLDIIIGEGCAARTLRVDLPHFTLIGATTRIGLISNPLRDRFGIPLHLEFYSEEELSNVIKRGANILNIEISNDASCEVARRSRGTPRIALRLLRRIRDFLEVDKTNNKKVISLDLAENALSKLGIDKMGLNRLDINYLRFINNVCGPVGIEGIAAALSEDSSNLDETVEPYLIKINFVQRTSRGRIITPDAIKYLNSAL